MKKLLLASFSLALCCSSAFAAQYVYTGSITGHAVPYREPWRSLNANDIQYGGYSGPGIVTMKVLTNTLYYNQTESGIYINCNSINGPIHAHIAAGNSFSCKVSGNGPAPELTWYADKSTIFGASGIISGSAPGK